MTFGRAAQRSNWSPTVLLAAARVGTIGAPGDNGYTIDRDWVITAVGADAFIARTDRVVVSLGAKGGVFWNHDRWTAVGAHPFGPSGSANWEKKAGLIIDGAARYQVGEHLSLASRVGLIQHIFTDDLIGPSGALISLGLAVAW